MNFFMCLSFLKNWHFLLRKAYKGVSRSVMLPLDDMAKCDGGGFGGLPPPFEAATFIHSSMFNVQSANLGQVSNS